MYCSVKGVVGPSLKNKKNRKEKRKEITEKERDVAQK